MIKIFLAILSLVGFYIRWVVSICRLYLSVGDKLDSPVFNFQIRYSTKIAQISGQ